ncbi:hypothetical protein [Blastococcus montanus]|uniref:hypothetical protein n=1 Tax=Blastococcus montanus TaxID=3144973 RepID=UPI0032096BFE
MSRSATRRRKALFGVLALLVLAGAGLVLLASRFLGDVTPASGATSASGPSGDQDAEAPVRDDVLDGPPPAPVDPPPGDSQVLPGPSPAPAALRPVTVDPTYSGWDPGPGDVVAGGSISEVIESGGTCTLTLTRDGVVVSGSAEATPDATTTSCGDVRAGGSDLTSGTWDAVLAYESPLSVGESRVFSVVVP